MLCKQIYQPIKGLPLKAKTFFEKESTKLKHFQHFPQLQHFLLHMPKMLCQKGEKKLKSLEVSPSHTDNITLFQRNVTHN